MNQPNVQPTVQVDENIIKAAMDADFGKLLDKSFAVTTEDNQQGKVVKGLITGYAQDDVLIDIGMKAEGRVSRKEFKYCDGDDVDLSVGKTVEVFVDNIDGPRGGAVLSREKAKREEVLTSLHDAFAKGEKVTGIIFSKVKGGFAVDVSGILAFMPGSQLDVLPTKSADPLMHQPLELAIIKLDPARGNIIVSRRAVQDEGRSEDRAEILNNIEEGQVVEGLVKNLTDFGAFVDLGGVDGLLHITDIAWQRINHPADVLSLGQKIQVKVIRFDEKTQRVSLGMKQLQDDPWTAASESFPIGAKVKGKVTSLADYGAFVSLDGGVEGLIHMSELSWTRKSVHPSKVLNEGQEVEVQVLDIDREKRRISLGYKQCQANPWESFASEFKEGDKVKGTIRSVTEFGLFVGLENDIDGLIHVSDISWEKSGEEALSDFKKGDEIEAIILAIETAKERVALGLKQASGDPLSTYMDAHKRGQEVQAKVTKVQDDGIEVELADKVICFIKSRDLDVEKDQQDSSRFKEGETVTVKIVQLSKKERKLAVSIKALQVAEEKAAIAEYTDSEEGGATLGDVLSEAMKK